MAAAGLLLLLVVAALAAPDALSPPDPSLAGAGPRQVPPLGADMHGVPLLGMVLQGAAIVVGPALAAGGLVALGCVLAGLLRVTAAPAVDLAVGMLSEVVGALPRLVVILIVALLLPRHSRSLAPIAMTWAVLALPAAMDEAAAVADALGGERFVEALRAHGLPWTRVYLVHVVGLNLRPVVVRHGTEVAVQVVLLELALSALTTLRQRPPLTHSDTHHSWGELLIEGYSALLGAGSVSALWIGLALVATVSVLATAARRAARAR